LSNKRYQHKRPEHDNPIILRDAFREYEDDEGNVTKVKTRRALSKGQYNRRIVGECKDDKRNYELHATKGYRSYIK